ncbi:hypothetical protein ACXJY6_01555 [Vibrio sp. RC27]
MTRIYWFVMLLMIGCVNASAHNVVGGVYADGFTIEGEVGFSNGSMASAGSVVKVSTQSGVALGEVLTDDEGFFTFQATQSITHVFEVNLGAGHQLTMQLPAEELPDSTALTIPMSESEQAQLGIDSATVSLATNSSINHLQLQKAIAKQIKPLRKEIQSLKEKSGLRDILGGIGYIFGLLGALALWREHKLKAKH